MEKMKNQRAKKREENKKKLVAEIANRKAYFALLWTIYWFGWATIKQIAKNNQRSQCRIGLILRNLRKWRMVKSRLPFYGAKSFWYLLKKGTEAIQFKYPDRTLHAPAKKNEVPENYYNHHRAVIDRIIAFQDMGYNCTSPRHSLWPDELRELSSNLRYRVTPDFWIRIKKEEYIMGGHLKTVWAGVEVEHSFRGSRYFPRKLAKQQKMTFDENGRIIWLYVPANRQVENSFRRVKRRFQAAGKYITRVKEQKGKRKEFEWIEIGLKKGIGFIFLDAEMKHWTVLSKDYLENSRFSIPEIILKMKDDIKRAKDIIENPYYVFTYFCKNCGKQIFLNTIREEFDKYPDEKAWTICCGNCGQTEDKSVGFFQEEMKRDGHYGDMNFAKEGVWLASGMKEGKRVIYLPEDFLRFLPF